MLESQEGLDPMEHQPDEEAAHAHSGGVEAPNGRVADLQESHEHQCLDAVGEDEHQGHEGADDEPLRVLQAGRAIEVEKLQVQHEDAEDFEDVFDGMAPGNLHLPEGRPHLHEDQQLRR